MHTFSAQGIYLFLLATGRIQKDLERMGRFREAFIQREWKDSERLVLWEAPDKEFLNKKINNREVYVDYGSTENIPEGALRLYGDLTALNWSKWLKF